MLKALPMYNGGRGRRVIDRVVRGNLELAKTHVISIIDDDPFVREATQCLVRSLGHTAQVFSSAEEYLQSGTGLKSACLITDLHMPGMSGADLQDHLIAEGHRVPIIFVTAYFEEDVRDRVMDAGALGLLRKPFSDESLIECLDKALNGGPAAQ
jgi:FixJ family two-component response regulator